MASIPQINKSMSGFEWTMVVILSIVWGGSFFFQGVAVKELPPLTIVFLRVALATSVLLVIMAVSGVKFPKSQKVWAAFFCMGLLNNAIPFSLIVWGQSHIGSGLASILNATTPLFTVVVAHFCTSDERINRTKIFGVIIGLLGVVIMIGSDALATLGVNVAAQIAVLAATISYAFAGVFGRCFREMGVPPLATATGQVFASSILLAPLVLLVDRPWSLAFPSSSAIAAIIGLATISTAYAYVLYFRILSSAGATNLLLVTFLVPVSAILLGVLVLGERLGVQHAIGMGCIGLGLAAIDGRLYRALKGAL
jgi:drug/metabolite transporter (DMT)-like permease